MREKLVREFLVPMTAGVRIDFDRDFLSPATISLIPISTITDAACYAVRHNKITPLSYCVPCGGGYTDRRVEVVAIIVI
jgi:hypothetical protein